MFFSFNSLCTKSLSCPIRIRSANNDIRITEKSNHSEGGEYSNDFISMLVDIYGSKDMFISEYRALFADRLLASLDCSKATVEAETKHLEQIKKRWVKWSVWSDQGDVSGVIGARRGEWSDRTKEMWVICVIRSRRGEWSDHCDHSKEMWVEWSDQEEVSGVICVIRSRRGEWSDLCDQSNKRWVECVIRSRRGEWSDQLRRYMNIHPNFMLHDMVIYWHNLFLKWNPVFARSLLSMQFYVKVEYLNWWTILFVSYHLITTIYYSYSYLQTLSMMIDSIM